MFHIDPNNFSQDSLHDVYKEIMQIIGFEAMYKLFMHYKGQQLTFPTRLHNKEYIKSVLQQQYDGTNLKQLTRSLGYSERWLRKLITDLGLQEKYSRGVHHDE